MTQRHPIGFTKINLARWRGWRIRVHIWHGTSSEAPHNHRWAFLGLPLLGTFTDTRWTETAGHTHAKVTTWPASAPGGRRYDDTSEPAGLTAAAVHTRRPLVPYLCRANAIHSYATRGRGPHISLVILAPPRRESSTVWRSA